MGRKISFAISFTASRGVQCSPASSLFSSLKRRTSSSKTVPMRVVVEAGVLHRAVAVQHRVRAQVDVRRENFSISVPSASAFERRGIWLRNSKFSRMSWTFGEKPSR